MGIESDSLVETRIVNRKCERFLELLDKIDKVVILKLLGIVVLMAACCKRSDEGHW